MKATDIRKKFLTFFASKGHSIVASDSLVPKNDPTVLFTTAGMQQFKNEFLGNIGEYTKATTSQKCLRTDDLDQVGVTDFHHTFFEMLGNFSFGDYFKKDAIRWGWEFLTKECKIPAEKLWVSVYKDDQEAENIWIKDIGLDPKKIVRLGDHSNFWPADAKENGPNGPCGPCSEIFFDYGVNADCDKGDQCDPDCDCGRFCEVWNLVFTQYERQEGGTLIPLPNKNIDTGMGLERLTAVLQGVKNNFETDIFIPIIKAIETDVLDNKTKISLKEKRIIADHIRAICFGINDGIIPSNKERGYVIKGLINACANIIVLNGIKQACIYKLVPTLVNGFKDAYPELSEKTEEMALLIKKTEEAFIKVCEEKMPQFIKELDEKLNSKEDKNYNVARFAEEVGELIFRFKDTHGLSLDILTNKLDQATQISAEERKQALSIYSKLMGKQQDQSRASSKMTGDVFTSSNIDLGCPKTDFAGHKHAETTSTILSIFKGDQKVNEANVGDEVKIILDKTPFYAESGGQVGDSGIIETSDAKVNIIDTQKMNDVFLHCGTVEEGTLKRNAQVKAKIDFNRRLDIMRNHTATHILQAALRKVLGSHVQQQGSFVSEDRMRFDFTHPKALSREEIIKIEKYANELILNCDSVHKEYLSAEEAKKTGALAFFAEKYGTVVRVVSIGDFSKEFCGGTHLDITGQIGMIKIISESAIAQGIRRIEAKTGQGAFEVTNTIENHLNEIAQILKAPAHELAARVREQANKIKLLEKDCEKYRFDALKAQLVTLSQKAEDFKEGKLIVEYFDLADMGLLRKIADQLKQKCPSAIIVLGGCIDESASLLLAISDDFIQQGFKSNELIKEIAPLIDGSGGGRPQMAQAGSKSGHKLKNALTQAQKIIKGK